MTHGVAVARFVFCLCVALPMPCHAAEALPFGVADALRQAAARDAEAFRAALRQAVAAAPDQKQAILRHALAAHPERAAELLLAGLYEPRLQPPDTVAGHTTNGAQVPQGGEVSVAEAKPEAIEEEGPWNGTVVLGATVRTGNTDNAGATTEATIAYQEGPWRHRARGSLDYLRNRSETLEQAFAAEYEAQYQFDIRTFSYGLARYEDDRFSGFDYEFTAAAGIGRHLVQEPGHEWTVTLGPGVRLSQPSESDQTNVAVGGRLTNLLSWDLSGNARLENESEALVDTERVRVSNDVVLKLRIIDQLSGQFSFGLQYRSDTPEEAEHTDTTTRAALVYDF